MEKGVEENIGNIVAASHDPRVRQALSRALEQASHNGSHVPSVDETIASAISYVSDPTLPQQKRVAGTPPVEFWGAVESLAECGLTLNREKGGPELVPCYDEQAGRFTVAPLPGSKSLEKLLTDSPFVSEVTTDVQHHEAGELSASSRIKLANGAEVETSKTLVPMHPPLDGVNLEEKAAHLALHDGMEQVANNYGSEVPLLQQALHLETICHRSVMETVSYIAQSQAEKVSPEHYTLPSEGQTQHEKQGESGAMGAGMH